MCRPLGDARFAMTEFTRMSPCLILLSGLPGSGKSVLAENISRALSIPIFSVDPIEAAMWRAGIEKTRTGPAADEVAQALADEHLRLRLAVVVDAVNPFEARRAAWRNLAAKYRVSPSRLSNASAPMKTIHRQRIEGRVRSVAGTHELSWSRLLPRRAEYDAWTDPRLVLDTSHVSPSQLLTQALNYVK